MLCCGLGPRHPVSVIFGSDMMRALIHSLRLQQCSEGTASWSDPHGSSRSRGFLCFFVYWCGVCLTGLVEGGLSSLMMDKLALITFNKYCNDIHRKSIDIDRTKCSGSVKSIYRISPD